MSLTVTVRRHSRSAGRTDVEHQWRTLQATLDAFGAAAGPPGRDQTVRAARQAFHALTKRPDDRG